MYEVFAYTDEKGRSAVREYIERLAERADKSKDSRIKYKKIQDYIAYLSEAGPLAYEPYAKHISGELWELRPLRDRIIYAAISGGRFILLHVFMKKTRKTPFRELEQALKNLADYRKRSEQNETGDAK